MEPFFIRPLFSVSRHHRARLTPIASPTHSRAVGLTFSKCRRCARAVGVTFSKCRRRPLAVG